MPSWEATGISPFLLLLPSDETQIVVIKTVHRPYNVQTMKLSLNNNPIWHSMWSTTLSDSFLFEANTIVDFKRHTRQSFIVLQEVLDHSKLKHSLNFFDKIKPVLGRKNTLMFGIYGLLSRKSSLKQLFRSGLYCFYILWKYKKSKFYFCIGRKDNWTFKVISFKRSLVKSFLKEVLVKSGIMKTFVSWILYYLGLYPLLQQEYIIVVEE